MKLQEFGLVLKAGGIKVGRISLVQPTRLFVNGNPSYTVHAADWGFFLTCEDDMAVWALMSSGSLRLTDLRTIIVDCRNFKIKNRLDQVRHIRDAISGRVSGRYAATIAQAIDWWIETQERENESHSP